MPVAIRPDSEDPNTFWNQYFRDPAVKADNLLVNLAYLRPAEKFEDIQAAIRAFLIHHPKDVQPWMYEMLAVSLSVNKGREADVRAAIGYAADLAIRNRIPHELTRIADTLAMHDMHERAEELLTLAADIEPGNPIAAMMAMTLAERTRDAQLMARAVEWLLSLGWPDVDESWRTETRRRVEALAESIREDGQDGEARKLLEQLAASENRDLFIRLTWAGEADLSLVVEEPLGATARVLTPRTVFGGALISNGYGDHREEVYVCPRAFDGDYRVRIEFAETAQGEPPSDIQLEIITNEGTTRETHRQVSIDPKATSPVVVHLEGGRRTRVLPYQAPIRPAGSAADSVAVGDDASRETHAAPPRPTFTPRDAADALKAAQPRR